jgi:hypothetical protein
VGWKDFCAVLNEVTEDRFIVISNNEHLLDLGDFGKGTEAVLDDGMTGDLEEWFGNVKRKGSESGSSRWSTDLRLSITGPSR